MGSTNKSKVTMKYVRIEVRVNTSGYFILAFNVLGNWPNSEEVPAT